MTHADHKNQKVDQIVSSVQNSFFSWDKDVLILNILGKPSARQNAICAVQGNQLKVSVTASPENGKATDRMVKFLAREFGVSRSNIEVVFGRMSVNKQLRIKSPKKLPPGIG
ncbi:MAG: DUF167 family protein [Spirochaetia bacterium]|nr:DUF167 family protein [Spirochaetia bacterium]